MIKYQLIFGEGASASIVSNFGSGYKLGQYKNHIDSSASDAIEFDNENFINIVVVKFLNML